MLIRIYKLTCDYCSQVVENDTNKFPKGWKWSQILLDPVKHICPDCLKAGKDADRNWKDGGQQNKKQKTNKTSRGEDSLKPMSLNKKQAAQIDKSMKEGTARPKIAIKPVNTVGITRRLVNRVKAAGGVVKRACAPIEENTPLYWDPPTPSKDDRKYYQSGEHLNVLWFGGMVVVALLICYLTNTYPWIDGVLKF